MNKLSDDEVEDMMERTIFQELELGNRVQVIADNYPDEKSLEVTFKDLQITLPDGQEDYPFFFPKQTIKQAEHAIYKHLGESYEDVHINFRITDLNEAKKKKIKALRKDDLGRLVRIDGLVSQTTEVVPEIKVSRWECANCGNVIDVEGGSEPLNCEGGCGKSSNKTNFELLYNESTYIDYQQLELQDPPEELRGGEEPKNITCRVRDDLVAMVSPGDHISVVGTVEGEKRNKNSKTLRLHFVANSIKVKNTAFDELEISEEERKELEEMGKNKAIKEDIISSIAPSIHGMRHEKIGMALQLFGGVRKRLADGSHRRGDMHILMVGDPGTAKSKLLEYMADLSPRGMFSSGKGTTAAGITAAAVREDILGENKWTLKAGTLVLADKGLAAIDELDKMSSDDRDSLHEAMEQQVIKQDKAGIHAKFNSRTSLLAACNPKESRFDRHMKISGQIGLPSSLISRFDLIFPITDVVNEEEDRKLAKHILDLHTEGQKIAKDPNYETKADHSPKIPKDKLKKYVSYAKTFKPVFKDEAKKMIEDYHIRMRKKSNDKRVAITPRQLESMVRMAEASARIHLREEINKDDAQLAIDMMRYFLKEVVQTEDGMDIDIILGEESARDRTLLESIRDIIRGKTDEGRGDAVPEEDILEAAENAGLSREEVRKTLKDMREKGDLYTPRKGEYKLA